MKDSPLRDHVRFLRRLVVNPRGVGAIAPSSVFLGNAVAAQIDPNLQGPILELGPGTGVITKAILMHGISPDRLVIIEHDPAFAKQIATRFKGVHVIADNAFNLKTLLNGQRFQRFAAVISGIPLLNFAPEQRRMLVDASLDKLVPGAPFIQFSYGLHAPVPAPEGATVTRAASVWRNIPPARVWVYRRI